jgi:limonene-1,2-epoxide hydrolase
MTPRETLEKWLQLFNAADADSIAMLYAADAVNFQIPNGPVNGREAIREMFAAEFAAAEMVCIPENIFGDGEWAILEWRDPKGFRGCGFFQVRNGQIILQRGYWDKLGFMKLYQQNEEQH